MKAFWKVLESFSQEDRKALLKFVTSCSRAPLGGFRHLNPPLTIHKVCILALLPTRTALLADIVASSALGKGVVDGDTAGNLASAAWPKGCTYYIARTSFAFPVVYVNATHCRVESLVRVLYYTCPPG